MNKSGQTNEPSARQIDNRILELGDWRADILKQVRALIKQADPDVVEACKWMKPRNPPGVPVWSHDGMICTAETYKAKIKLTFARGAYLDDPQGLFNAGLQGKTRRAIDISEGEQIDEEPFGDLIRAAVVHNVSRSKG